MNDVSSQKINSYLTHLQQSLDLSSDHSRDIVEEIRGDLHSRVQALQAQGKTEEEAVDLALQDLGEADALSSRIRGEVPPWNQPGVRMIRYGLATLISLWALCLLWTFRAWTYGFSPWMYLVVLALHLPLIIVLWPGIVWKRNWLFGLVPAGICLSAFVIYAAIGVKTDPTTISLSPTAAPVPVQDESSWPAPRILFVGLLTTLTLYLITFIQRNRQRRRILVSLLAVGLLVEIPFQIEERAFRERRHGIAAAVTAYTERNGMLPTKEALGAEHPSLLSPPIRYNLTRSAQSYQLFWIRPLMNGFSICYASDRDRIWIND